MDSIFAVTLPVEDAAVTLRAFLATVRDDWQTGFVQLGGDHTRVPARLCWSDYGGPYGVRSHLDDLYFACWPRS